jgi:hypothetical protein
MHIPEAGVLEARNGNLLQGLLSRIGSEIIRIGLGLLSEDQEAGRDQ